MLDLFRTLAAGLQGPLGATDHMRAPNSATSLRAGLVASTM